MDTNALKKFAQSARNLLIDQVSSKLALVLDPASPARREHPDAMKKLDATIATKGKGQVIEQVAYTWFNRFTALRFMDVNGYTNPRVVSPADGATRPEILADALAGNLPDGAPPSIAALLEGRTPSNDPQAEAYRLLLVHACNQWHGPMPFLFEQIDDYSELLMPEDLLSPTSILARLRDAMADDACADVEIIGWLYQFYISEKKDQVFAGLKKNVKITAENIPAATQLFTPHWIVRYLVENSLGRLWLLNRPHSKLAAQMDYYIAPEEPETDFLKLDRPEDIRICDPACGSGHMLTYAFDLLHAIYAEEGYDADAIPALILTHNLHGVEIDDRAGALAAFALVMKAAAKLGRRKFLRLGVQPNICVMQDVRFTADDVRDVAAVVGRDLFTAELRETCAQFEQAKNFGSLIVPKLRDPAEVARVVRLKEFGGDLLLRDVQERVLKVLEMAEALSPKYHVVVANPPYMGAGGMNQTLKKWLSDHFPQSKNDTMTAFMQRSQYLSRSSGYWGMINLPSWMFLGSFAGLRQNLLKGQSIASLLHLGRGIFGSDFGSVAFCVKNQQGSELVATFRRLFEEHVKVRTVSEIETLFLNDDYNHFCINPRQLLRIPNAPIAYWLKNLEMFEGQSVGDDWISGGRNKTHDNEKYLRYFWEVSSRNSRWNQYANGGDFRKYSGNELEIVDWSDDARNFYDSHGGLANAKFWSSEGVCWPLITAARTSFRIKTVREEYSSGSPTIFPKSENHNIAELVAYLNSTVVHYLLKAINPTVNTTVGDILSLPYLRSDKWTLVDDRTKDCIRIARSDWDAYEISWDFTTLPLLAPAHRAETLAASYATLRAHWQGMTEEMQRLEEENNRIFIDAYGLQDELTPEVPLDEITLTCNPAYRYGGKATAEELETRLRADTMAEFLHY
ncbi:MAG: BREX-1 system adenine-specific DNA-methyltransferase PglX, partial [Roseovarius sp.]|nr:BREX-1 system adenine-specific DNA-methyltransferase PglX [Roseovarius sp.]